MKRIKKTLKGKGKIVAALAVVISFAAVLVWHQMQNASAHNQENPGYSRTYTNGYGRFYVDGPGNKSSWLEVKFYCSGLGKKVTQGTFNNKARYVTFSENQGGGGDYDLHLASWSATTYKNNNGNIVVDAIYKDETLWLSQKGMSKVFECSTDNISLHLKHIFEDNELDKKSVTEKCSLTADDGKNYNTTIYSLDAIIAVGYRINSKKATEFRIWATKILKEYMIKGFALNDERFINGNKYDTKYFDELLERIKTIRVSERMSYQKITDLFIATATDYNPKSEEAYTFFKIVQNKLHYAISGHTAAELIYSRANSDKEHMGLTNWKNSPDGLIYKYDVIIAKNYLNEEEMNNLKDLTNLFLVFAEDEAKQRHVMTMKDWINATDDLLKFRRKEILNNSGSISHKEAVEKAEKEYEKFRVIQDQKYISSMDEFYKKYLNENKYN